MFFNEEKQCNKELCTVCFQTKYIWKKKKNHLPKDAIVSTSQ